MKKVFGGINLNDSINKISGFVCLDKDARLEGNACIIYEKIYAKHN